MSGIFSPFQSAARDAFQKSSACFSQSAAGALLSAWGALLPPARIEPSLYLRTSSGVTKLMSAWTTWPTFSSTLMRLRMRSIRVSIFGSRGTALCTDGQWTELCPAGAASAAPASNRASTPASPNFRMPFPSELDATLDDNAIISQDAADGGDRKCGLLG